MKLSKNLLLMIALVAGYGGLNCYAGVGSGGGADWSMYKNQNFNVGGLADLSGPLPTLREYNHYGVGLILDRFLADGKPEQVESVFFDYYKKKNPAEADALSKALHSLNFVEAETIPTLSTGFADSSSLHDRVPLAYQNSGTRTVYLQKANYTDSQVKGYATGYEFLGSVGKAFLRIHEGYIRLGFDRGLDLKAAETFARNNVSTAISDPELEKQIVQAIGVDYASVVDLMRAMLPGTLYTVGGTDAEKSPEVLKQFLEVANGVGITCAPSLTQKTQFVQNITTINGSLSKTFHELCGYSDENGPEATLDFDYATTASAIIPAPNFYIPTLVKPNSGKIYLMVQSIDRLCTTGQVEIRMNDNSVFGNINEPIEMSIDWNQARFNVSVVAKFNCSKPTMGKIFLMSDKNRVNETFLSDIFTSGETASDNVNWSNNSFFFSTR